MTQVQSEQRLNEGRKILAQKSLSLSNVTKLIDLGFCAFVYPRKKLVVVNGFQKYQLR